ncbi:hypothetical protein C8Q74DRAFT_808227 [Fomes fomentarius]|nr:hypothetical protein C8Q74DRAFT_808227 [Fomes fomentarius]
MATLTVPARPCPSLPPPPPPRPFPQRLSLLCIYVSVRLHRGPTGPVMSLINVTSLTILTSLMLVRCAPTALLGNRTYKHSLPSPRRLRLALSFFALPPTISTFVSTVPFIHPSLNSSRNRSPRPPRSLGHPPASILPVLGSRVFLLPLPQLSVPVPLNFL